MSKLPRETDRVAILLNPKAGPTAAQPRAERLAEQLRRHSFRVELFTHVAAATTKANQWFAEGSLRTIVAAGGDGTAAAVVNGTAEGIPITLFPAGNSNLLARYFGLSSNPAALCQTICEGAVARVDAGLANKRIFLLMASCGFDAEVVRRVHQRRTGHASNRSYLKPILESMWSYPFPGIRIHWENSAEEVSDPQPAARWLFVFNLPCYGGGIPVVPQADGSDGLLDVCGLQHGGVAAGVRYLVTALTRQHHRLPDWSVRRVRQLRLTSEAEVPYQLDGDPGGVLPIDLQALPNRLTLLVPRP